MTVDTNDDDDVARKDGRQQECEGHNRSCVNSNANDPQCRQLLLRHGKWLELLRKTASCEEQGDGFSFRGVHVRLENCTNVE